MKRCSKALFLGLMVFGLVWGSVGMARADLTVNSVVGSWANAQPAGSSPGDPVIANGNPLSTVRWGIPVYPQHQSGYDFLAVTTPFNAVVDGTAFGLGTFTHHNYPVYAPSLTSIDLNVSLSIFGFGALSPAFHFTHNETSNNATPETNPLNNDIVTLTNPALNATFSDGTNTYFFNLIGFSTNGGATIASYFSTVETLDNDAQLYARITSRPITTPEPTTLLLLGLGLMGLAGVRRYKK
ncbi:MAG: THxN family PEP-CTERM protein [Deltaproteobacteria bacterium]|nr:THxN family PEP-CTERM protein [Deltaproteobacteria bacterium]